jgi:hypothetical protein
MNRSHKFWRFTLYLYQVFEELEPLKHRISVSNFDADLLDLERQQKIMTQELENVKLENDVLILDKLQTFSDLVEENMKALIRDKNELNKEMKKVFNYFGETDSEINQGILTIFNKFLSELKV